MKRTMNRFLMLVCFCLMICFINSVSPEVAEARTVRVGVFESLGYYQYSENNVLSGYDIDYLRKISEYTKWRIEYVYCGTWANAMDMLSAGKIDLLGTAQYTPERSKRFIYTECAYGLTYSAIVALEDNNFNYQDYDAFQGKTIGCVRDYVRIPEFERYLEKHNLHVNVVYYDSLQEVQRALQKREIDMIACSTHSMNSDEKIIDKYMTTSYYFIANKHNQSLIDELDNAIWEIQINYPAFQSVLVERYFPGRDNIPLSKDEIQYIKAVPAIKVGCISDCPPISFYDGKTGEINGFTVELLKKIAELTGLQFEFVPVDANDNPQELIKSHRIDVWAGMISDFSTIASKQGMYISNSMFDLEIGLYGKKTMQFDSKNPYTVALPRSWASYIDYIKQQYPNFRIKVYNTPQKCLDAVWENDANLVIMDSYMAQYLMLDENIKSVAMVPLSSQRVNIGMAVRDGDKLLLSILNKARGQIDSKDINSMMTQELMHSNKNVVLRDLVYENIDIIATVLFMLLCAAVVVLVQIYKSRLEKRQAVILIRKNQELSAAIKAAQKANSAKSMFLSKMSHEIRTPLNVILGMMQIAQDKLKVHEAVDDCLIKAQVSAKHLLSLINDILDISKIENEKLQLNLGEVDVGELLDRLEIMYQAEAFVHGIGFKLNNELPEELVIKADGLRLNQILVNLLSNAVKFTEVGGSVMLNVRVKESQAETVIIAFSVEDTGTGIKGEDLERIFNAFEQGKSGIESDYKGTGLGLSIAASLAKLMGSQINVTTEHNVGSKFFFDAEFAVVNRPSVEEPKKSTVVSTVPEFSGKRILLVEDNDINAEIAEVMMKKTKVEIDWVENGKEAVDKFAASAEYTYNLIFMDIRMPIMDGYEAARRIRSLDRADARTVKICAMTANAFTEDVEAALASGMDRHLAKPFDKVQLYQTMQELL